MEGLRDGAKGVACVKAWRQENMAFRGLVSHTVGEDSKG